MRRTIAIVALLLGIAINANAQTRIHINTRWKLQRVNDTITVPATIPGTVHTDLWHARQIPNPFAGCNEAPTTVAQMEVVVGESVGIMVDALTGK